VPPPTEPESGKLPGHDLVSIGLPVRNGAATIRAALESLVAQDHPAIEIIVSDNASTDATLAVVEEMARADRRIRIIRQERNIRMMANFHAVAAAARGSFFMWAAADDTRSPDYVRLLLEGFARHPDAVCVHGDTDEVFPDSGAVRRHAPRFVTLGLSPAARLRRIVGGQSFFLYGLWRTEVARALPMRELYWWPDMPPMLAAAALGEFAHRPGPVFRYTHHPRPFLRDRRSALTALPLLVSGCFAAVRKVAGTRLGLVAAALALALVGRQISDFAAVRLGLKKPYAAAEADSPPLEQRPL
jgi:glycosyltransferase involved in cell wall biosynthesis